MSLSKEWHEEGNLLVLLSHLLVRDRNNLDLLRVVLATLVIVGHTNPLNGLASGFPDPVYALFPMEHIHTLAVKIFLFVSGLVVTNSLLETRSGGTFLISRSFRILPNLFVLLVLTVFVIAPFLTQIPVAQYFSDPSTYGYLAKNSYFETRYFLPGVFEGNPYPSAVNGSLWTLAIEVPCYLVILSVFLFSVRFGREREVLALLALATILDTALNSRFFFSFLGNNPEVYMLPSVFAFGALFALFKDRLVIDLRLPLAMAVLTVIFRESPIYHSLLLMTCCLVALWAFTRPILNRLKLPFDVSYGVYLWGFLVQQTIVYWFGPMAWWIHVGLSIVVTFAIATVCHVLVEKPFIAMGKTMIKRFYPKPSKPQN